MDHKVVCFTYIVFWMSLCVYSDESNKCLTPKNSKGECIPISSCKPLLSILQNRPITSEGADLLKTSHCGFEKSEPKVCCPSTQEETNSIPSIKEEGGLEDKEEDIESVTSKLLPKTDVCGGYTEVKVVGGEKAGLLEFPWMALIGYQKEDDKKSEVDYNCGGTLINSRYVVTAAHCIEGTSIVENFWKPVSVRLGEYDTTTNPDCDDEFCSDEVSFDVPIEETIVPKGYNASDRNFYDDIALLRLTREVKFTDFVRPICLPTSKQLLQASYANKMLTVAGWGQTESGKSSNIKLKLQVPVKSDEYCKSKYGRRLPLQKGQICAGGQFRKDSCKGDSGGPLMTIEHEGTINWYLVGVVSIGPDRCGTTLWPGIYTRVASYVRWIVQNIKP